VSDQSPKVVETPKVLDELFSVECPALGQKVIMTKDTWYGHILKGPTGHPEMAHKRELIERAVKSFAAGSRPFFAYTDRADNEWFADFVCVDFKPANNALRIAFKKLDDGTIIFATAFPMRRGIISYVPK
jgi:hypothetical protein